MQREETQEQINKNFKDKQDRIARQTALQVAEKTVTVNPASQIKEPTIIASKIIDVAEYYLHWIETGEKIR